MPWDLPESESKLLALARGYPYCRPEASYLFAEGMARPLPASVARLDLFDGRSAVVAHGSNRSPRQLARKFGSSAQIPVSRARLADYDVVYSAHMTRYGAIAANLCHLPGATVEVWITWLTADQLARMHATELGAEIYRFGTLSGVHLALESGPAPEIQEAGVYLSTYGYLPLDGAPIGLAAVPAEGRPHKGLHQHEVQALVRDRHRPGRDLDELLLTKIREPARRQALIEEMRARALPPEAPHFQPLDP